MRGGGVVCGEVAFAFLVWRRGKEGGDSLSGNMMMSCAVQSLDCAGEYLVASAYVTHAAAVQLQTRRAREGRSPAFVSPTTGH